MSDFLLELFSEEIPARMQRWAEKELSDKLYKALVEAYLPISPADIMRFVTPRRLAVRIVNMPETQNDIVIEKKGPKSSAPQAAVDGFLKANDLSQSQLEKRVIGKDEVWFYAAEEKGKPARDVLPALIEKLLAEFTWPKSMRWGSHDMHWVRPLHNILCMLDGAVLPVRFNHLEANNYTYGHRFLAPEKIVLAAPSQYEEKLQEASVIADFSKRQSTVWQMMQQAAAEYSAELKEDVRLLEEVTGLVEFPTVRIGSIDAKFMHLPEEVLVSEMKQHQKYFPLYGADGKMLPKFLITANTHLGEANVIAGNQRVLRARLSDGEFFWDQDRKTKLAQHAEKLSTVTYHAKIGSSADKVTSTKTLALKIADTLKIDRSKVERAATLSKADLVTGMVGEFPELQGVMGRYYAIEQGEATEVADAIRDHYLPLGPDSPVPIAPVSIALALADKLDTLIAMFAIGEKPTGSKDPFALRRAALGIIRIILENKLRLPLTGLGVTSELLEFFHDRLKVTLKDQGIRHDVVAAVLATGKEDDLLRLVTRASALQQFVASDNGANLIAGYKRAANIVGIEEKKDKRSYSEAPDAGRLVEAEETQLALALQAALPKTQSALASENYAEAMQQIAALRPAIDAFFDKIMVNADDKTLRENRLLLLAQIRATLNVVADFSQIEG